MTTCIVGGITFVSIPKNASTTISVWFHDHFLRQITYGVTKEAHASISMIENRTAVTCAVVRNPWDRVVSMWAYEKRNPFRMRERRLPVTDIPPFDEYVRNLSKYSLNDGAWFTWATPQKEWIPDGVTHLLRFETLEHDFKNIQTLLGCNAPLKHVNNSERTYYRTYYTRETQTIVAEMFKADIEAFGYFF